MQEGGFSSSRTPLRLHVASDLLEAAGGSEFEFKGCVALGLFGLEASKPSKRIPMQRQAIYWLLSIHKLVTTNSENCRTSLYIPISAEAKRRTGLRLVRL